MLSALGSHSGDSGATELPSDILRAWGARKEKLAAEADDAQHRQQKLTVGQRAAIRPTYGMGVECYDAVLHKGCFQMYPVEMRQYKKSCCPASVAKHLGCFATQTTTVSGWERGVIYLLSCIFQGEPAQV